MAQNIPLAWKQLTFERMKFTTAIAGVMVAVMLMWIQLGILATLYASATEVHRHVNADLVVMHPLSENLNKMKPFSARTLFRVRGHPDVTEVGELFVSPVDWRNPQTGEMKSIVVYGFDADAGWLDLPGVREHAAELRTADTFLFDRNSKDVFGPVKPWLAEGRPFEVELARRRCRPVGLTAVAASFGQEGSIIASRENFLRLHGEFSPNELHVGLVRLRTGADIKAVQEEFRREFDSHAVVLTPREFTEFELRFWKTNAPVGFIFTMGTAVGFFIGFIVVYQILYTDVTNNLPQYATMKAVGFSDGFLLRLVMRQAAMLSVLGYIPGSVLAIVFYKVVQAGTGIKVNPTWERGGLLLGLTCMMCLLSGAMATRKLRAADPADVF